MDGFYLRAVNFYVYASFSGKPLRNLENKSVKTLSFLCISLPKQVKLTEGKSINTFLVLSSFFRLRDLVLLFKILVTNKKNMRQYRRTFRYCHGIISNCQKKRNIHKKDA